MSAAKDSAPTKRRKATKADPPPLKDSAGEAIEHFLKTLDGEPYSEEDMEPPPEPEAPADE